MWGGERPNLHSLDGGNTWEWPDPMQYQPVRDNSGQPMYANPCEQVHAEAKSAEHRGGAIRRKQRLGEAMEAPQKIVSADRPAPTLRCSARQSSKLLASGDESGDAFPRLLSPNSVAAGEDSSRARAIPARSAWPTGETSGFSGAYSAVHPRRPGTGLAPMLAALSRCVISVSAFKSAQRKFWDFRRRRKFPLLSARQESSLYPSCPMV